MPENAQTDKTQASAPARPARKKKKSQVPFGVLVFLFIAAVGIALGFYNSNLALFWVFGCAFGFVLQKSRFCFTASMRDPCITGSTSVTRAVLIAFAIATIG
ncbi:MAG: transporter, partial [Oscillospiraceae bacterium]|nr:transporter [Oscillospiraceae bacterium]